MGRNSFKITSQEIEMIVKEFHLDILATEKVAFSFNPFSVYKVNSKKITNPEYKGLKIPPETYILYAPEIVEISSHPHIVGKELDRKCERVGEYCAKAILSLWNINPKSTLIYDVLRAGPGYKIREGFQKLNLHLPRIKIRPRYKKPSYRQHDAYADQLEIIYKDFSNLPSHQEIIVIKPDTEASGGTSKIAIETLIREAQKKKSKIKEIICTGYISVPSLDVLQSLAEKYNFQCKVLAWGNLTALYSNRYDMPLYGLDEAAWREKGIIRKIGGVVPAEVLLDYLLVYPPGADQPGDWSARQSYLDTGKAIQPGENRSHLEHSLSFLCSLYQFSRQQPWFCRWHKEIFLKEINKLQSCLEK